MDSQMLIQAEASHVSQTHSYSEHRTTTSSTTSAASATTGVKKKRSMKKNKDENNISVSRSSSRLARKMKGEEESVACAACARPVFAMERVKAEKRAWHRECFRCVECGKQLTVETYESNQTNLYCKQHFKTLFAPRVVEDEEEVPKTPKKHQVIICESNPKELPPDVARASDKPDLGLEELSTLDVKSRFQLFEQASKNPEEPPPLEHHGARDKSATLLSRLAKFKAKGMDIGVSDEYLNGIPIEPSSSEGEEDDEDSVLKKSYKQCSTREQPVSFCNMSEIVGRFESGDHDSSERRQERKQEIQNIRSRLFMGKQAKIKEMYEQSVMQSEQAITSADKIRALEVDGERSRAIKQRFENGEVFQEEARVTRDRDIEDETLFNDGIGKKSRTIFLELDAVAASAGPVSPPAAAEPPRRKEKPFVPRELVRAADRTDEVRAPTADISDKFQFFETYRPKEERRQFRMTPPRDVQRKSPSPEVYRDPEVVRAEDAEPPAADTGLAQQRHTASRMIGVFKQLELEQSRKEQPQGPKPLKSFTPPPPGAEYRARSSSPDYSEECSEEEDSEDERQRGYAAARQRDEALQQAQALARAKNLRNRFEHWSETEQVPRSPSNIIIERQPSQDDDESQIETAKSLRAKFENMKTNNVVKTFAAPKVNRFV